MKRSNEEPTFLFRHLLNIVYIATDVIQHLIINKKRMRFFMTNQLCLGVLFIFSFVKVSLNIEKTILYW